MAEQSVANQSRYETRHRELRQALATTPSNAPFPSIALQNALDFEHRTAEPVNEFVAAARELFDVFDPDDGDMPARQYHALRDLYGKLVALDEASGR